MRKWGDSNPTAGDMAELDFSEAAPEGSKGLSVGPDFLKNLVDEHSRGSVSKDGLYEIKDLDINLGSDAADDAINEAFSRASSGAGGKSSEASSSTNYSSFGLGGLFARLTGSKVLTKEDLAPVLAGMKDHLMKKNVAVDIADKICEGVGDSLIGKRIGGFSSTCVLSPTDHGSHPPFRSRQDACPNSLV